MRYNQVIAFLLFVFSASVSCVAQTPEHPIFVWVSDGVFDRDPEIKAVVDTWDAYLNSHADSVYDNPYWNAAEKKRYATYDLLNGEFNPGLYYIMKSYPPTILSVAQVGGYYKVRTLFASVTDSGHVSPLAITNVYAKKVDTAFKFYNALPINTARWRHTTLGSITFIYPPSHTFNRKLAEKLLHFVDTVSAHLGVRPVPVDYYLNDNYDELKHAQGYDFWMGEGNRHTASGKSDAFNHVVYGSGEGEYYAHEFVHIYAIPKYPHADDYFHEGIATLLAGSRGYSLDWHLIHADSILTADTAFNVDTLLSESWSENLDYTTGVNYAFGGLICKLLIEKGGWPLLLRFGEYTPNVDARFQAMKELLGVERADAGRFIREKLHEQAMLARPAQSSVKPSGKVGRHGQSAH